MAEKHSKAHRRFGPRYGRTTKSKVGAIEAEQKKSHGCPYCKKDKVRRVSKGIWACGKCGAKFTGKAYTFDPKLIRM